MKFKTEWSDGLATWWEDDTLYMSVAFSWKLPDALDRATFFHRAGKTVKVGGPASLFAKRMFDGLAEVGGHVQDALRRHNPDATRASSGCPVGCSFCAVPAVEGKTFTLFPDFTPRPVLCDNNLSALPIEYQEYIIERYTKTGVPLFDINSGFEPQTFDDDCFHRWDGVNRGVWRWGFDETKEEEGALKVATILKDVPQYRKRVYVMIGNEPFEPCLRRVMKAIEWGCDPHAQPVYALGTLEKIPMVRYDWTAQKLKDLARWTNRHMWRAFPFSEYEATGHGHGKEVA